MSAQTNRNNLICSVSDLNKNFVNFVALKNVNLTILEGEKIGLVGANGSGKTTLLKILAKLMPADSGVINIPKSLKVAYIPQEFHVHHDSTVKDFIYSLGTVAEGELFTLLGRLELNPNLLERQMSNLSGGEKTKIGLLRILLSDFDFYLLDEPTNNLDLKALAILEKFVKDSAKTFLIISHDREFLDQTVGKIAEINEHNHSLKVFAGNFTAYREQREADIEREWSKYNDKMQQAGKMEIDMDNKFSWMKKIEKVRFGIRDLPKNEKEKGCAAYLRDKEAKAGRRLRVAKDRLEKFEEDTEDIEKPKELLPLHVNFEIDKRSGDKVFEVKDVTKKFKNHSLGPINLEVTYGDRILITGNNGSGKTTLLKIILGQVKPDAGEIKTGQSIQLGYLPQTEDFLPENTLLEEFMKHTEIEEGTGRKLLNRFRLTVDDVHKKISQLSSGERSRLTLAIIMTRKANCLILDEPSNHLDLEVLSELEKALKDYKGTLIVVSHDRYFVKRVGFDIMLELQDGELTHFRHRHLVV
ncbi:MAG: ABC-F family ATP-binding cassette domain-containing protein [Minisyncoccia bacterium]